MTNATAMMLALVAGVVGMTAMPTAAAAGNCENEDFVITSTVDMRPLGAANSQLGKSVVSSSASETLRVEVLDSGTLKWTVFCSVLGSCTKFTLNDGGGELTAPGADGCTLDAPPTGSKDYFVLVENDGAGAFDHEIVSS